MKNFYPAVENFVPNGLEKFPLSLAKVNLKKYQIP
jgi:hypothetical protein